MAKCGPSGYLKSKTRALRSIHLQYYKYTLPRQWKGIFAATPAARKLLAHWEEINPSKEPYMSWWIFTCINNPGLTALTFEDIIISSNNAKTICMKQTQFLKNSKMHLRYVEWEGTSITRILHGCPFTRPTGRSWLILDMFVKHPATNWPVSAEVLLSHMHSILLHTFALFGDFVLFGVISYICNDHTCSRWPDVVQVNKIKVHVLNNSAIAYVRRQCDEYPVPPPLSNRCI